MKSFARVENGLVAERLDCDVLPPFHPSLCWVECDPQTSVGMGAVIGDGHATFFTNVATLEPTERDVILERERRLSLGFNYDFGDERGVHRIGTTPADMAGWDEVTMAAQAMVATGGGSGVIAIKTDTGGVAVTAQEWMGVLLAAHAFRQPIWMVSFMLMGMTPIPTDYCSDSYWI